MKVDHEKLMAYADGELSASERLQIEAALAQDEALRAKLAAHQALRTRLSTAFDGALADPIPPALIAAAQKSDETKIVDLAHRRALKWSVREWGAMAASLAIGTVIGFGAMNAHTPMIVAADNGLAAHGALARALDTQLASEPAGAVRIGLSFRAQDGAYCRTFDLTQSEVSGLACRNESETWTIAVTSAGSGGEVRTAGASDQIIATVEAMIAGEPLNAARELAARNANWR